MAARCVGGYASRLPLRERREFLHHLFVDRALERHDQVGEVPQRLPPPLHEFRLVAPGGMRDVDLAVLAGEAQRVPLLALAAILAVPGLAGDLGRDVVAEPLLAAAELLDRTDVGLLIEFALGCRPGLLAGVDAALRHLPHMNRVDMFGPVEAAPDEDEPIAVEYCEAHAGPVGKRFESGHADHSGWGRGAATAACIAAGPA